jgi:hypothetical protein
MSDQPRDWDRELADIDKVIAKMPAPAPAPARAGAPGAPPAPAPRNAPPATRRRDHAATWLWVLVGLGLSIVLPTWPYAANCGAGLIGFLGADAALVIVALLGMMASWRARRGRANALSLLMLIWGLAIGADAVLPRIGYAKATATWRCTAPPPQPTAPASTAPTTQGG